MFSILRGCILSLSLAVILSLLMLLILSTILCKQGPCTFTRSNTMTKLQSRGFSCSGYDFAALLCNALACTLSFPDTLSLMDEHLPLLAAELSAMAAVSMWCLWSSMRQSKLDKLPRSPPWRDYEDKRPAGYDDQQVGYDDWRGPDPYYDCCRDDCRDNHRHNEKEVQYDDRASRHNGDGGWH